MLREPLAVVATAALVASCIQSTGSPQSEGPPTTTQHVAELDAACAAPHRLLTTRSDFQDALLLWSRDTVGSPRALAALERACDGDSDSESAPRGTEHAACSLLGLVHASGEGVPRDASKGFQFLERGARGGFSFGANDLAQARTNHGILGEAVGCGIGIGCAHGCEAECARAAAAVADAVGPPLETACAAGRGVACFMLADLVRGEHLRGVGAVMVTSKKDVDTLIGEACKANVGAACLHQRYLLQGDAAATVALRARLTQRACDLDWGDACLKIGMSHERAGQRAQAIPYWVKACRLGLVAVCTDLTTILSKGEAARAQ